MQYRKDKYGQDLSILGFDCMRFTRKGNSIDLPKAEEEIMEAFRAGVNYYDTAYIYPGSEVLLGTVLQRNGIRDQVKIATKLPQYLVRNLSGAEKFFREELERLQTDHVDYHGRLAMGTTEDAWDPGLDQGEERVRGDPEHRLLVPREHGKFPEGPSGL